MAVLEHCDECALEAKRQPTPEVVPSALRQSAIRAGAQRAASILEILLWRSAGGFVVETAVVVGVQSTHQNVENRQCRAEFHLVEVSGTLQQTFVFQQFGGDMRREEGLGDMHTVHPIGNLVAVAVNERDLAFVVHQKIRGIEIIDKHIVCRKELDFFDKVQRCQRKLLACPIWEILADEAGAAEGQEGFSRAFAHDESDDFLVGVHCRHDRPGSEFCLRDGLHLHHVHDSLTQFAHFGGVSQGVFLVDLHKEVRIQRHFIDCALAARAFLILGAE